MSFKNTTAEKTTVTRDMVEYENVPGNVYEALVIMAKRADQISVAMKEELNQKLAEFATTQDSLEEVFENREQIEISKFYEQLPKPPAISAKEMLEGNVYFRHPEPEAPVKVETED